MRVPADISVIGFDNSIESLTNNLTSYHFDFASAIHALIWHVLYPAQGRLKAGATVVREVEGALIERGTTAAARST